MQNFLALLGMGIDAGPAKRGAREFEDAAGKATRAGEKATDSALKQDRAYRTAAGGTKAFSDALSTLNRILVVTGLAALAGMVIRTGSAFEDLRARLVTLERSASGADAALSRLQTFAAKTPFELRNATEAYIQLKARGIDPTMERLTAFGDIAASFGRDITDIAAAVGGAVTGEFESLKGFGIVARAEGDAVAFTYNGVTTIVEKNAQAIAGYLQRLGEAEFAGGMARQSETLSGKLSTLQDELATTASLIFEGGLGSALKATVTIVTEWIGRANEAIQAVGGIGNVFKLAQVDVMKFAATGIEAVTNFTATVARRFADSYRYVAEFFSVFTDNDVARLLGQIPGWNLGVAALKKVVDDSRLAARGLDEAANAVAQNGKAWVDVTRQAADLTLAEVLADIAKKAPEAGSALAAVPPPDSDRERLDKYLKTLQGIREELEDQTAIARVIREFSVGLETATKVVELVRSSGGILTESRALEYIQAIAEAEGQAQAAADALNLALEEIVDNALDLGGAFDRIKVAVPTTDDLVASAGAAADDIFDFGDIPKAKAKESADAFSQAYENAAYDVSYLISGMFGEILRGGEVTWGDLFSGMVDIAINAFQQIVQEWIAAKLTMEAANVSVSGGGGGGGINAGSLGGATGASAATLATVAAVAVMAYAWYNDRQHDYERIEGAIRDIEDVFEKLSDTLGQVIPTIAGQIEVRKDGDRYRSRVGFDDGSAGYAYFDQYADAVGAAVLSGLRESLSRTDPYAPLANLGEEAKKVIAGITDEIINMGQAGVAWLQEGLDLARELDQLGMSDMERTLAGLRKEYDENIRKAGEYGLSLQKVGDLYRQQLADVEASLRSRIAQYLPGYDPVGQEFDQIRRDNEAIRTEYDRLRQALEDQISQVLLTIRRLEEGAGEGALGGGNGAAARELAQTDEALETLMNSLVRIGQGHGGVAVVIEALGELDQQLFDLGNLASGGGGGGIGPDAADRIAQQRERLADLMRELGLLGGGLSDEEINAAERAARQRQNRSNRAAERSAYEDQLRAIADSALPDLVSQLKATRDQMDEVAAEAARLGVNADLSQAALAALNQQLGEQAQDAYLSLAERMAQAIGDEETLRDIAQLRWDLERAQMLLQIDMLEEMGFLQADQIERLRDLYGRLPTTAPGNGAGDPPTDVAGGVLSGFGIDFDALMGQVDLLRNAASIVDALSGGIKIAIPGLVELRKKIEGMDDAARQFVGDSLFLSFGDQLLSFVQRYYGDTKQGEQLRIALEQVRFQLELANLNAQFALLQSLGLLTDQQITLIQGALDFLNDPANWPDFDLPDTRGDGGYSAPDPVDDRAAELERFFEALARWEQLGLSDARRELMDLREEFDDLRATAIRLGQSVSRVDAAYQNAIEDFWDRTLAPYEDRAETAQDRLQQVRDHFAELIDLAGEYGGDLERILAAQQQAVSDLWDEILGPLRDYQSQLMGSALSAATPEERLLAAQADFQRLADAALAGDVNAIQQLPAAIQALLQEAQNYYGTGAAYQALYSSIQSIIDQILGLGGIAAGSGPGGVAIGDRGPVLNPGGVDIGGLVPRIPQQPLLPQVPQVAQGESETVRLLKDQLAEQQRINREQARLLTEMVTEMRRTREETAEMKQELFALAQVQRRTNTALEDQARTKATAPKVDAA